MIPFSTINDRSCTMSMFCNLQRQLLVIGNITYVRFSFSIRNYFITLISHVSSHKLLFIIYLQKFHICVPVCDGTMGPIIIIIIYRKGEMFSNSSQIDSNATKWQQTIFFGDCCWLVVRCVDFYYSTFSNTFALRKFHQRLIIIYL